ncbi:hypothetical protein OH76DRAFT_804618 [Lentinus brumalis]|uniref:Uncharacterized protein n=1 Tax=Lentinus brumalis TaxID=2498619 RepID=A0A371D2Q6_9APHY|nr:hypothetical protein OH76DRAFT_804618 [Polyporus brumalis]
MPPSKGSGRLAGFASQQGGPCIVAASALRIVATQLSMYLSHGSSSVGLPASSFTPTPPKHPTPAFTSASVSIFSISLSISAHAVILPCPHTYNSALTVENAFDPHVHTHGHAVPRPVPSRRSSRCFSTHTRVILLILPYGHVASVSTFYMGVAQKPPSCTSSAPHLHMFRIRMFHDRVNMI